MGSVRISLTLEEKIRQVALKKGLTRSEVFREALESYCEQELTPPNKSRYDDVIGIVDGPSDGSERVSDYFTEGLGKIDALSKKHG